MRKAIGFMIFCCGLAACTTDDRIARETPAQLTNETFYTLATAYFDDHDPAVKAEMMRRKVVPVADWPMIDNRQVAIGMYNFEVIAAWGQPDRVRDRTTRAGTKSRFTYYSCKGCQKAYLDFDVDGVLTQIIN